MCSIRTSGSGATVGAPVVHVSALGSARRIPLTDEAAPAGERRRPAGDFRPVVDVLGDEPAGAEAEDGDARQRELSGALEPAAPPLDGGPVRGHERLAEPALDRIRLGEDALEVRARR